MQSHLVTVFGLELSFKAQTDPQQLERVCVLLEERFSKLVQTGGHVSKEKLLAFLALSIGADLLQLEEERELTEQRLQQLLDTIDK